MVMFATTGSHDHGVKDSASNIRATGEFVCNMATMDLKEQVKISSLPLLPSDNEFLRAGLETEPSRIVKPPRVKGSPIHIECVLVTTLELPQGVRDSNIVTVGRVVGVHIDDRVLENGIIDVSRLRPLARLGYDRFAEIGSVFDVKVPTLDKQRRKTSTQNMAQ